MLIELEELAVECASGVHKYLVFVGIERPSLNDESYTGSSDSGARHQRPRWRGRRLHHGEDLII